MRALLQKPTLELYQAVFDLLVASEHYRPRSQDVEDMEALLDQKKYNLVIEKYKSANPNYVLDPHAGMLVAAAHRNLGNTQLADVYTFNARHVCEAIRTTGDGTSDRPYRVTHLSSGVGFCEIIFATKDFTTRTLIRDRRHLLAVICADGPEVWFDTTAARTPQRPAPKAAPALPEASPGTQTTQKHAFTAPSETPPVRNLENHASIVAHVEQHIGKVAQVLQEVVSPVVFIDVLVVPPTPERNWHTLVTSGMSSRAMSVPDGAEDFRYAELMICLPAEWKLDAASLNHEEFNWPLRWLRLLARNVHQYKTWFSYGHTIPNGEPAVPFAFNTKMSSILLMPVQSVPRFRLLDTGHKQTHFPALVPIYNEELTLCLKAGPKALIQCLNENGVDELLNLQRKNTQ